MYTIPRLRVNNTSRDHPCDEFLRLCKTKVLHVLMIEDENSLLIGTEKNEDTIYEISYPDFFITHLLKVIFKHEVYSISSNCVTWSPATANIELIFRQPSPSLEATRNKGGLYNKSTLMCNKLNAHTCHRMDNLLKEWTSCLNLYVRRKCQVSSKMSSVVDRSGTHE